MKQRIIQIIKHWDAFYRCISKIYWTLNPLHLSELIIGTKAREKHWATRSIAERYWNVPDLPHKGFLVKSIVAFSPSSILEVGCASGLNLYLLAKKLPKVRIVGIDINQEAIRFGNTQFALEKIPNAKLFVGKADKLGEFKDRTFDIVFTNGLLVCIGPDKIKVVIKELLRVTHHKLMLMELHCPEPNGFYSGNWIRNYGTLLKQFIPEEQIQITQHLKNVWLVEPWLEYGTVIEATKGRGK